MKQLKRPSNDRSAQSLRSFDLPEGLGSLPALKLEIQEYWDVLLGRAAPPVSAGRTEALMETADAYYARGMEISALILEAENTGVLKKDSPFVRFRTGPLRHFCEVAKRAADMGSRRITVRGQEIESERTGRDRRQV